MKRYFPLILIIVMVITVIQQRKKKTDFTKDNLQEYSENTELEEQGDLFFQDLTGGYTLTYPSDWKLQDSSYKDEFIRADLYKGNDIGLQIRLYNLNNQILDDFITDYVKQFQEDMKKRWNGEMEILNRRTIAGKNGEFRQIEINFTKNDGERWTFIEYVWQLDDKILVFQSGYLTEKVIEGKSKLDKIANSLKF